MGHRGKDPVVRSRRRAQQSPVPLVVRWREHPGNGAGLSCAPKETFWLFTLSSQCDNDQFIRLRTAGLRLEPISAGETTVGPETRLSLPFARTGRGEASVTDQTGQKCCILNTEALCQAFSGRESLWTRVRFADPLDLVTAGSRSP